jgi:hypothetical protein
MGQPIEGSNPSLSATSSTPSPTPVCAAVRGARGVRRGGAAEDGPENRAFAHRREPLLGRAVPGCYDSPAVLGGELAVPCTCNPLQQG